MYSGDGPRACPSALRSGGDCGVGRRYSSGQKTRWPMIRLLFFVSFLFLAAAECRASDWQAEWLAAVGSGDLAALIDDYLRPGAGDQESSR